LTNSYSL